MQGVLSNLMYTGSRFWANRVHADAQAFNSTLRSNMVGAPVPPVMSERGFFERLPQTSLLLEKSLRASRIFLVCILLYMYIYTSLSVCFLNMACYVEPLLELFIYAPLIMFIMFQGGTNPPQARPHPIWEPPSPTVGSSIGWGQAGGCLSRPQGGTNPPPV